MSLRRTMMFLPGNNPNMIMNGAVLNVLSPDGLGADSIILDLEDAVAPDQKDAARDLVTSALRYFDFGKCEVIVRINSLDTPFWEEDLEAVVPLKPAIIMPTKVSSKAYIHELVAKIDEIEAKYDIAPDTIKIIPLLETALGIENAFEIATASKRVEALYLGAEDLTADLRCKRTKEGTEIFYARSRLVCAARAAGIDAYDTPFTDVNDLDGLKKDAEFAKSLGFAGKAVISPRHVETVNKVFSPTRAEIEHAKDVYRAIKEAKAQGKGAISLNGKMIDAPIVMRAKIILDNAIAIGLETGDDENE